jgi:hypothetical protein
MFSETWDSLVEYLYTDVRLVVLEYLATNEELTLSAAAGEGWILDLLRNRIRRPRLLLWAACRYGRPTIAQWLVWRFPHVAPFDCTRQDSDLLRAACEGGCEQIVSWLNKIAGPVSAFQVAHTFSYYQQWSAFDRTLIMMDDEDRADALEQGLCDAYRSNDKKRVNILAAELRAKGVSNPFTERIAGYACAFADAQLLTETFAQYDPSGCVRRDSKAMLQFIWYAAERGSDLGVDALVAMLAPADRASAQQYAFKVLAENGHVRAARDLVARLVISPDSLPSIYAEMFVGAAVKGSMNELERLHDTHLITDHTMDRAIDAAMINNQIGSAICVMTLGAGIYNRFEINHAERLFPYDCSVGFIDGMRYRYPRQSHLYELMHIARNILQALFLTGHIRGAEEFMKLTRKSHMLFRLAADESLPRLRETLPRRKEMVEWIEKRLAEC